MPGEERLLGNWDKLQKREKTTDRGHLRKINMGY